MFIEALFTIAKTWKQPKHLSISKWIKNGICMQLNITLPQKKWWHSAICNNVSCLPWWLSSKELPCQCRRHGLNSWVRKIPWRRKWQPTPVLLPGKFHGWGSLIGYGPWGRKESDTTERLHFHFSFFDKGGKNLQREMTIPSISSSGKTGQLHVKEWN